LREINELKLEKKREMIVLTEIHFFKLLSFQSVLSRSTKESNSDVYALYGLPYEGEDSTQVTLELFYKLSN
jgi:hypothetical protein